MENLKDKMLNVINHGAYISNVDGSDKNEFVAEDCSRVAIQYTIDVLKGVSFGALSHMMIDVKISELQSLLKQPKP